MQLTELIADTLFLANTVEAQYSQTNIKRNLNVYYDMEVLKIWNSVSDWQFDEGVGTLPVAYTNLVSGQDNYQLPTEAREIERVEIKNTNGDYIRIEPIDHNAERVIGTERTGMPKRYDMVGRSIVLYPTPDHSQDSGVLVKMSRSVTHLDESTDEPKIEREFHRLLSLGAAMDWCISKGNRSKKRELEREQMKLQRKLVSFYSQRNKDYDTKLTPKRHSYDS